jgi:hypothetical protein
MSVNSTARSIRDSRAPDTLRRSFPFANHARSLETGQAKASHPLALRPDEGWSSGSASPALAKANQSATAKAQAAQITPARSLLLIAIEAIMDALIPPSRARMGR